MKQYYKVARLDGYDFHTGRTINYRENIGKTVKNPKQSDSNELCSNNVLHASELFIDAFSYGENPCSVFVVSGNPVSEQSDKCGFKELRVDEEIPTSNFRQAYYKWMIWLLNDLKNNELDKRTLDAVEQTISVFSNAQKTGYIDATAAWSAAESAARSAWSAAESAAWSAESAARSAARSAESAARSAAKKRELSEKFIEFLRELA